MPRRARFGFVPITGLLIAVLGQVGLSRSEQTPHSRPLAVLALVVGAGLFSIGCGQRLVADRQNQWPPFTPLPKPVFRGAAAIGVGTTGLVAFALLLYRLNRGSTAGYDLILWIAAIILIGIAIASGSGAAASARAAGDRVGVPDLLGVLLIVGLFVSLNVWDLNDWRYSAIGDEYAFYNSALSLLEHGVSRPFAQAGVYDVHPVLDSVYQALIMAVFGADHFGWTLSSVLSVAVAIPGVYLIGWSLGSGSVGLVAAGLFAFSHYVMAFSHIGYNSIHALAPAVWAVALFVLGCRRRSRLLLYASGLAAALGFYTFFSARLTVAVIVLFVLTDRPLRARLRDLWPFGVGFTVGLAPIAAVSGRKLAMAMLQEIPGGYSRFSTGPVGPHVVRNLGVNALAFNYNPHGGHYVSGSLLDPMTAVLAVLGVGLAFRRLNDRSYRLLLLWALVGLVGTGGLSPYAHAAVTRLHFVVPPLVLLAAFASYEVLKAVPLPAQGLFRHWIGISAAVVLLGSVLALNLWRFWFETPKRVGSTPEAVAIGAARSGACRAGAAQSVIVTRETALLRFALDAWFRKDSRPRFVMQEDFRTIGALSSGSRQCVIFAYPAEEAERAALDDLSRRYPSGQVLTRSDSTGITRVAIFALDTQTD